MDPILEKEEEEEEDYCHLMISYYKFTVCISLLLSLPSDFMNIYVCIIGEFERMSINKLQLNFN
jgi:hypothetical protein